MPTQATVEAVYEDCRPTIEKTALRFARAYRRDPEECVAEATYQFLLAFRTFRPGENLDRRVRFVVWRELMDKLREDINRHLPTVPVGGPDADPAYRHPPGGGWWDREGFLASLTPDGRTLAELVLDTPPDLQAAIAADGCPGNAAVRRALRSHAVGKLGWSPERYVLAFDDVEVELLWKT